jgi:D-alanine-D-alanine ligase
MDKILFKRLLLLHGIPTPSFHAFSEIAFRELGGARTFPRLLDELGLPVVVKPVAQGSSIGIKLVDRSEQVPGAILGAFGYGDRVLIEERVDGRELAVTVLGAGEELEVLPIVEVHTPANFYSYEAHYTIGEVRLEAPADLESGMRDRVHEVAMASYRAMGCRDFGRVDLILDADGNPQVLEINTIPGLTETGITPAAAEAAGIGFTELVKRIVARVA